MLLRMQNWGRENKHTIIQDVVNKCMQVTPSKLSYAFVYDLAPNPLEESIEKGRIVEAMQATFALMLKQQMNMRIGDLITHVFTQYLYGDTVDDHVSNNSIWRTHWAQVMVTAKKVWNKVLETFRCTIYTLAQHDKLKGIRFKINLQETLNHYHFGYWELYRNLATQGINTEENIMSENDDEWIKFVLDQRLKLFDVCLGKYQEHLAKIFVDNTSITSPFVATKLRDFTLFKYQFSCMDIYLFLQFVKTKTNPTGDSVEIKTLRKPWPGMFTPASLSRPNPIFTENFNLFRSSAGLLRYSHYSKEKMQHLVGKWDEEMYILRGKHAMGLVYSCFLKQLSLNPIDPAAITATKKKLDKNRVKMIDHGRYVDLDVNTWTDLKLPQNAKKKFEVLG